ncbi:MAG: hypothetical protein NZ742_00325 [Acidobacteria bacterium]|nr:hypothetical protein [Acidobacteriota bacterium]MDW7983198.1 hypothetical protein [Acidobacteriota bacterium]
MKLKQSFLRLLRTDPEFYEEVRRAILTDELLNLPVLMQELTQTFRESAERTDQQIARLTESLQVLTARVDQLTESLQVLTARVDQLTEDVRALTARVDQLTEDLRVLTARVDQLTIQVSRLAGQVGRLSEEVGGLLEIKYRQHPYGYFGGILRRAHWVTGDELEDLLERALQIGRITEKEAQVLRMTDVIVRGFREGRTVWLTVEVSGTIERDDIQRALERAVLLTRCVPDNVFPVVAGMHCPEEVREGALRTGVWIVQDGQVFAPASQEANR